MTPSPRISALIQKGGRRAESFWAVVAAELGVPTATVNEMTYLAAVDALRAKRQAGLVMR